LRVPLDRSPTNSPTLARVHVLHAAQGDTAPRRHQPASRAPQARSPKNSPTQAPFYVQHAAREPTAQHLPSPALIATRVMRPKTGQRRRPVPPAPQGSMPPLKGVLNVSPVGREVSLKDSPIQAQAHAPHATREHTARRLPPPALIAARVVPPATCQGRRPVLPAPQESMPPVRVPPTVSIRPSASRGAGW
jgi:hypothetical protein